MGARTAERSDRLNELQPCSLSLGLFDMSQSSLASPVSTDVHDWAGPWLAISPTLAGAVAGVGGTLALGRDAGIEIHVAVPAEQSALHALDALGVGSLVAMESGGEVKGIEAFLRFFVVETKPSTIFFPTPFSNDASVKEFSYAVWKVLAESQISGKRPWVRDRRSSAPDQCLLRYHGARRDENAVGRILVGCDLRASPGLPGSLSPVV